MQWKLTRLIGEGGLAAVYQAQDQQGGKERAIKLLHAQFVTNRAIVERFYAEAKACFSLRHPHIAAVEAYAYAEDGTPYIVMELLKGVSLEEYLRKKQPMPPEQASPLLYSILQALSCAHARAIVHRDLKPANLFLVPVGEGMFLVKVLDFGIAKVMDLAGGMGSKTRTGAVLGTPRYMSPEQVKNAKAVDARTDLWATGVVFYEMLTCQHPFGSTDQLARMVAVLRDPPTPISEIVPHLANGDPFFEKALSRNTATRFQSAEEMAANLREVAQGSPARFVPDGLQTVALPIAPDMIAAGASLDAVVNAAQQGAAQAGGQPAASAVAPATQGAAQAAHGAAAVSQDALQVSPAAPLVSPNGVQVSQAAPVFPQGGAPAVSHAQVSQHVAHQAHGQATPPGGAPSGVAGAVGAAQQQQQVQIAHQGGTATQISAAKPAGTPTIQSDLPAVNIMTAADDEPASLVWWGVVLVALATFAFGLLVGYLAGY